MAGHTVCKHAPQPAEAIRSAPDLSNRMAAREDEHHQALLLACFLNIGRRN